MTFESTELRNDAVATRWGHPRQRAGFYPDHGAPRRSTPVLRKLGLVFLVERRSSCWADTTAVGHPCPHPTIGLRSTGSQPLRNKELVSQIPTKQATKNDFPSDRGNRTLKLATYVGAWHANRRRVNRNAPWIANSRTARIDRP